MLLVSSPSPAWLPAVSVCPSHVPLPQATPLQELYENNRAKARRAALAAEQAAAEEEACRFHPDTSASGRSKSTGRERRSSSPGAGAYGGNQVGGGAVGGGAGAVWEPLGVCWQCLGMHS